MRILVIYVLLQNTTEGNVSVYLVYSIIIETL